MEPIERLIGERTQARKEKNWARADEIRAELDALNVQVTDTPTGPVWEYAVVTEVRQTSTVHF